MTKTIILFIAILLMFPIMILSAYMFHDTDFTWLYGIINHRYLLNTILLAVFVGIITSILGVTSAICVTLFEFPGRRIFQALLFLPLAFPSYITAFIYGYLLEFAGPVQTFLRTNIGIHNFPNIHSLSGVIFVMSIAFYPYIYVLVRANLVSLSGLINTAQMMGKSKREILFEVVIPISKMAIISGVSLVIMEVIADFGTPQFFAVDTFTTGIYRTWFLLNDYPTAARLTCIILVLVFVILFIERRARQNKVYHGFINDSGLLRRWKINSTSSKISIYTFCCIIPLIGFIIPTALLIHWSIEASHLIDLRVISFIANSIEIALVASCIIVTISMLFVYCIRKKHPLSSIIRIASMGYAVPSSVIAVGIVVFLAMISKYINMFTYNYFHIKINIMLVGTMFSLLYAYTVRFLSISMGAMESGFNKVPREIDWTSHMLGYNIWRTCFSIHIPMLFKSIMAAFLLIFIDVIKELSATLIVRPFNFETITTRTYDLIMDERYREAAFPALIITSICMLSIFLIVRFLDDKSLYTDHNYVKSYSA